ncbi:uncharacterized protein LOC133391620 [Anopheles gambiae]|uniref:uncharacterized protein LOC133391620 n=1 Tax=Anopheles gambiae TaxID=7165 RepID=UPI002AC8E559|nr:uncharacterized protein LOC133391620 [Anopheles gambiae]
MSKRGFDCGGCERHNTVDDMVLCEKCEKWYHYGCAGVTAEIKFQEWRCESCVKVAKSEARGTGQPKPAKEAIAKPGKPAGSCKGNETKNAAPSEGETSGRTASAETLQPTTSQAARPPSAKSSKAHSRNSSAALERLAKVQELEREMAVKEFELKMASLKLEQEKLRLQFEEEAERGSHRSFASNSLKTEEWVRDQQQLHQQQHEQQQQQHEPLHQQQLHQLQQQQQQYNPAACTSDVAVSALVETVTVNPTTVAAVAETRRRGLTEDQVVARQIYPKKLPTFRGSTKEWLVFISCYNDSTEACGFTDRENIIRLEECLQGPARDAVLSKLNTPKAAPLVIKTLERLYGRPALVVKELLDQARRTEAPKPEHLESLITYGMAVQQLCDQLVTADQEDHLNNPMLLEELAEKLPASRRLEWVRYKSRVTRPNLRDFGEFIDRLLDEACEACKYVPPDKSQQRHNSGRPPHTFGRYPVNVHSQPRVTVMGSRCPICSDQHHVRFCETFRTMTVQCRRQAVKEKALCEICLNAHGSKRCLSRIRCDIAGCGARHNTLLHETVRPEVAQCMAHNTVTRSSELLFRVVPVTIYYGQKSVETLAFLDDGSSVTLVETDLARSLGVIGMPEPLEMSWTSDITRVESSSMRISLEISARGDSRRYELSNARTVQKLSLPPQELIFSSLTTNFAHFQGLSVRPYLKEEPKLLIGLQHINLLAPLETRIGGPGEPIAVRSPLGWAIYGPCNNNQSNNTMHHTVRELA